MAHLVEPEGGRLREVFPPLLVLLSGAAILGLVLLRAPTAVRAVPMLGYLAVVPGLACMRLVRLPDGFTELLLGIGLSLALGVLVAQTMLYLHRWSPLLGLSALVLIASLAASVELFRHRAPARYRSAATQTRS